MIAKHFAFHDYAYEIRQSFAIAVAGFIIFCENFLALFGKLSALELLLTLKA